MRQYLSAEADELQPTHSVVHPMLAIDLVLHCLLVFEQVLVKNL